jgi:mannose-6-phosphate isomerase-like protein (cupin superfamily)
METMHETIRIGAMSVTFLKTRHETGGVFDLFELTIPPLVHVAMPHIHRKYDETIFGLNGHMTWTLGDKPNPVNKGTVLFIPRGVPHFYENRHHTPGRILCLQTPGIMGPEYYHELASLYSQYGVADIASIAATMSRYGIVPVTNNKHLTPIGPEA